MTSSGLMYQIYLERHLLVNDGNICRDWLAYIKSKQLKQLFSTLFVLCSHGSLNNYHHYVRVKTKNKMKSLKMCSVRYRSVLHSMCEGGRLRGKRKYL